MPVLKFDVSASDPEEARGKEMTQARPGVYLGKVTKIVIAKPEGKDQRLEVTGQITEGEFKGWMNTDYINMESEATVWKMDQFLQAIGEADSTKRKGSFNTDKIVGKAVKIRVRGDSFTPEGETVAQYRGKIAAWLSIDDEEAVTEDPHAGADPFEMGPHLLVQVRR